MGVRRFASLTVALALVGAACTSTTTSGSGTSGGGSGRDAPVDLLHQRGAAADAISAIERAVGASPARVTDVDIYPEYVFAEAQDPGVLDHIDRYQWRDDDVPTPEPVQLSGPQEDVEASLFPTSSVRWQRLATMVEEAERAALRNEPLRIESPRASYVTVDRSMSSDDDGTVVVRVYISGPRRSGYVEMTATGTIRAVNVN
ncbi:MAG TPA: hypothetical protein VFW06_08635 [Acidimicrobiia bacterium]|nr:hypothetical protein [Acidimicrobiia bacterium]